MFIHVTTQASLICCHAPCLSCAPAEAPASSLRKRNTQAIITTRHQHLSPTNVCRAASLLATEAKSKRLAAQVKFGPKMGPQPPPPPITSQAPSPSPSPSPTPHIRQPTRPGIHPPTRRSTTSNTVTTATAKSSREQPSSAAVDASSRPSTGNSSARHQGPRPRLTNNGGQAANVKSARKPTSAAIPAHTGVVAPQTGMDPAHHIVSPVDQASSEGQKTGVAGEHTLESHPLASSDDQARKSTSAPVTPLCTPQLHAPPAVIAFPHRPVALSPILRTAPATPIPSLASMGGKHAVSPESPTPAGLNSGSRRPELEVDLPAQTATSMSTSPLPTNIKPSPITADFPLSRSTSPSPSPSPTATYTTLLRSFPPTPSPLADFARAAHPFFRCRNEPINLQPLASPTCILQSRSRAQTPQAQSRSLRVHTLSQQERTASHYSLLLPPSPSSASPTPNPSPSPMRLFTPRHSTLLLTHTLDKLPLTLGGDFGSCFGSGIGSGLNSGSTNSSRLSFPRPTSAPPDSPSTSSRPSQPVPWDSGSRATSSSTVISGGGTSTSSTRLRPLNFPSQLQHNDSHISMVGSSCASQQVQSQVQHHRRGGGSSYTDLVSGCSSGRVGLLRSRSSSLSSMVSSLSSPCCSPHTRSGQASLPVTETVAPSVSLFSRLCDLQEEEGVSGVERLASSPLPKTPHSQETAITPAAAARAHTDPHGGNSVAAAIGSASPSHACSGSNGYSTEAEAAALSASQRLKLLQQQQHSPRGRAHTVTSEIANSPYGNGDRAGRGRLGSSSGQRTSASNAIPPFRPSVHTPLPSPAGLAPHNGHGLSSPRAIYSRLVNMGRTSLTSLPRAGSKGSNSVADAAVAASVAAGNADVYKYVTDPEGQPHIGNGIQPFVHPHVI